MPVYAPPTSNDFFNSDSLKLPQVLQQTKQSCISRCPGHHCTPWTQSKEIQNLTQIWSFYLGESWGMQERQFLCCNNNWNCQGTLAMSPKYCIPPHNVYERLRTSATSYKVLQSTANSKYLRHFQTPLSLCGITKIGMPKFGPEPQFEPWMLEPNLRFRFSPVWFLLLRVGSVQGSGLER
jgi:hypothetical protein